jgi:hypothetical protein
MGEMLTQVVTVPVEDRVVDGGLRGPRFVPRL